MLYLFANQINEINIATSFDTLSYCPVTAYVTQDMQEYGTFVSFCMCLKQSKMHERQQLKYPIIDFFAVYGHISVLLNSISSPFRIDATAPHINSHIRTHTYTHNRKQTNIHLSLYLYSITSNKDARLQKNNKHVLCYFYLNSTEYISTLEADLICFV